MKRENWKSRAGFILAALGSAVGLGSIWRFPYMVGENGGSAFIFLYLLFLFLIGLPVLLSEIILGRKAQKDPYGAIRQTAGKKWGPLGKLVIITGLLISSFYSVIAGWTLAYFLFSLTGKVIHLSSVDLASSFFSEISSSFFLSLFFHFAFLILCGWILLSGVKKGIEAKSKILMPALFVVLLFLAIYALFLPGGGKSLSFLFSFSWDSFTPKIAIPALGQAFFTLSLGQGTMITYGSYLSRKEEIVKSCVPVVFLNLFTSLLMGVAIYGIVFSSPVSIASGPALIFETLPVVFSTLPGGYIWSSLFFFLVVIAALTSEISALEPAISYLIDEKKFSRKKATLYATSFAFFLGIFTVFSFSPLNQALFGSFSFYEMLSFVSVNILVPLGGLGAVYLVGWKWPKREVFAELHPAKKGREPVSLLLFCLRYITPVLILIILLDLFF